MEHTYVAGAKQVTRAGGGWCQRGGHAPLCRALWDVQESATENIPALNCIGILFSQ